MISVLKTGRTDPTVDDLAPYQIGLREAYDKADDTLCVNDNGAIAVLAKNSLKAKNSYSAEYYTKKDNLRDTLLEKYCYTNNDSYMKISVLDQSTSLIGFTSNIADTFHISLQLAYEDGTSFYSVKHITNSATSSKMTGAIAVKPNPTEDDYTNYAAAFADTSSNSTGSTQFYAVTNEDPVLAHYIIMTSYFTYDATVHKIDSNYYFIEDNLVLKDEED